MKYIMEVILTQRKSKIHVLYDLIVFFVSNYVNSALSDFRYIPVLKLLIFHCLP